MRNQTSFSSSSSRHPSHPITLLAHPSNFIMYREKRDAKKDTKRLLAICNTWWSVFDSNISTTTSVPPPSQTCQISANRNTGFPSINDASLHFCKNRLISHLESIPRVAHPPRHQWERFTSPSIQSVPNSQTFPIPHMHTPIGSDASQSFAFTLHSIPTLLFSRRSL